MARKTALSVFSISVPKEDIAKTRDLLDHIQDGSVKVMTRSLNATAKKVRNKSITATKFGVRSEVRLDKVYVDSQIKGPKEKAQNRATFARQEAKITAPFRGSRMTRYVVSPIPDLGAKGSARSDGPIKVKIKPRGKTKTVKGRSGDSQPFFVRLRKGNWPGQKIGVFVTRPSGGKLKHLYSDSLAQVLKRKLPLLSEFGLKDLEERIIAETKRELKRFESGF